MPEIDILIGEHEAAEEDDPADEVPEVGDGPPVTRPGDSHPSPNLNSEWPVGWGSGVPSP